MYIVPRDTDSALDADSHDAEATNLQHYITSRQGSAAASECDAPAACR